MYSRVVHANSKRLCSVAGDFLAYIVRGRLSLHAFVSPGTYTCLRDLASVTIIRDEYLIKLDVKEVVIA